MFIAVALLFFVDPCHLVFLRKRAGVFLSFVLVLFSAPYFKFDYILIDMLHTLDLGVTAKLAATSIARLLQHQKLGNTKTKGFCQGLREFNKLLKQHISAESKRYRQQMKGSLTCVHQISLQMLGLGSSLTAAPMLKGSGVEVRHVLSLCIRVFASTWGPYPVAGSCSQP